jgi:hypothetical protein
MVSETRERLRLAIKAAMALAAKTSMSWGRDDCAMWCGNILRDVLGYDPVAIYRGRYWSRGGALRVLGSAGIAAAVAGAAERHGWRPIEADEAQAGDIALARPHPRGPLVTVICLAPDWFVGRNKVGFAALRGAKIERAWAVI